MSLQILKRTMDGDAFGRLREEIERYYTENNQAFAIVVKMGTYQQKVKQDSILVKYKKVLSRILPEQMLSEEGLFKGTTSKDINISQTRNFVDWARYLLGRPGASHTSDTRPYVSQALLEVKGQIDPSDYSDLEAELSYEMGQKQRSSRIFIPRGSRKADSALAHETVHDIQHNLRKHYPDIYTKLIESAVARKSQIVELIDKNKDKVGYSSASIFGVDESKLAYSGTGSSIMGRMVGIKTNEKLSSPQQILANKIDGYHRNDEILAMLMELESVGVSEASSILSDVLESSGLKARAIAP